MGFAAVINGQRPCHYVATQACHCATCERSLALSPHSRIFHVRFAAVINGQRPRHFCGRSLALSPTAGFCGDVLVFIVLCFVSSRLEVICTWQSLIRDPASAPELLSPCGSRLQSQGYIQVHVIPRRSGTHSIPGFFVRQSGGSGSSPSSVSSG